MSTLEHLEHPTAFDASTCIRKGLCPITKLRSESTLLAESHSLYYEIHGRNGCINPAARKLVFIMGLNSSSFGWGPQVRHFSGAGGPGTTSLEREEYTVLVFDNRGVGNSGYPRGPYTTSEMAEDVITLLDYIDWTASRDLHIVGISLGGMIAQELAWRIPERIASLLLAVTTPGGRFWNNLPPWKGFTSLTRILLTSQIPDRIPIIMEMLFPKKWLDEKAEDDPEGRTNREVQSHGYLSRVMITKPQQFIGHISQMGAGLTHHVSPSRLRTISSSIPKITIVTGDDDHLVPPYRSKQIKASMPEAEYVEWEATGHGVHFQRAKWFNDLVVKTVREGVERSKAEKDTIGR